MRPKVRKEIFFTAHFFPRLCLCAIVSATALAICEIFVFEQICRVAFRRDLNAVSQTVRLLN